MVQDTACVVRPLNPDNESEIQHLIALFSRTSGSGGTRSRALRSAQYWRNATIRKFAALIAIAQGKIVAHCGFGCDKHSPTLGVLSHPAFDPDATELLPEIASQFDAVIEAQAARKGLSALISYRCSLDASIADKLLDELSVVTVAELSDETLGVSVGAKAFGRSGGRALHNVPASLRSRAAALYRAMGETVLNGAQSEDSVSKPYPADARAVEALRLPRSGWALLFVAPSLALSTTATLRMPEALERALLRWPHSAVCVDMADPRCAPMVALLQANGFSYSGILPALRGRESIVFTRGEHASNVPLGSELAISRRGSLLAS